MWGAGVIVAIVAAIVLTWNLRTLPQRSGVDHLTVTLPAGVSLGQTGIPIALSPDGRQLAFVGRSGGSGRLYHRPLDQPGAVALEGTEGALNPFFSPDSRWIGFMAGGMMRRVSLGGGVPEDIRELPANAITSFAQWGPNDRILFNSAPDSGIFTVPATGGDPQVVTTPAEGEVFHSQPWRLPNGRDFVFFVWRGSPPEAPYLAVYSHETGEHRPIVETAGHGQFASSGHIVFHSADNRLSAVSFDPDGLEVAGTAAPVLGGVRQSLNYGIKQFWVGADGTLTYVPGGATNIPDRSLVWVDRAGNEEPIEADVAAYQHPRVSPDGRRVAARIDDDQEIWTVDLERGISTRLTFDPAWDGSPIWSPSGDRIMFSAHRVQPGGVLFWKRADGAGPATEIFGMPGRGLTPTSWSSDGRYVAAIASDLESTNELDIGMISMVGEPAWQPLFSEPYLETDPAISPDGRWIVYLSSESGALEVYVRPFPNVERGRTQISDGGADDPSWSPDGREVYYRGPTHMMAVSVTTDPSFSVGVAAPLFEDVYAFGIGRNYDVGRDGRFLMVKNEGSVDSAVRQINIVRNWTEELKARVPPN